MGAHASSDGAGGWTAETRLRFLAQATDLLAGSLDYEETLERVAELAVPALADWCVVDEVRDDGELARVAVVAADARKQELLELLQERYPPTWDSPQPAAHAVRTRGAVLFAELTPEVIAANAVDEGHAALLRELEPRAAIAVPLVAHDEVIGAMSFAAAESGRRYGEEDVRLAEQLARRVALALDRARLYRSEQRARLEAEAAGERLRFLAETTAILGSSLDYETTLERLARLVVPALADCCVVDVLDERRQVRQVAVAHVDPERAELVRRLEERYPTSESDPRSLVGLALREATTVELPDLDVGVDEIAQDAEHAEGLRELALVSGMIVPLIARGQTLGAITLLTSTSLRRYGPDDLTLAEQLASRAAIAVDNARLYREAAERGRAARALATVADGVLLLDRDGVVRLWNPGAERITGLAAAEVLGRPARGAIPGWSEVEHALPVAHEGGPAPRPLAVPLDIDGRELWLSFAGVGFEDGTVFTFRDLTEERRLEEYRSEFVATASHELRTPLAAVYGAAVTLRRGDIRLTEEEREVLLAVIADESDRLARIVNDILWASRVDSSDTDIRIAPFDARQTARRVIESAQAHLPEGIEIALETPERLPRVAADEPKLAQVLTNLVDNAVKYSPDGGRVAVRLEPGRGRLRLVVEDEGLGIPADEHERIFEKFYRLDPNQTRGVGGTGLGLYICRALVERMGGRISLQSEEGEGSAFTVELPLAADENM